MVQIPERLGSFYLGSVVDLNTGVVVGPQVHYDARDLTTHAVCVGMTGSGKTGLCIGLLEEAALDRVPAIIIDPKGDMGNLLLHFPELQGSDFRQWANEDDARRKGVSVDQFADSTASQWRKGLSEWGIGPDRIRMLENSVAYSIYTPGSESVQPVNVLGSLRAPDKSDTEALRESVAGFVEALLGLVGIDADPVKSQEAIFLSVLLEHYWGNGQDVDLGLLVRGIQDPPVRKFGVFDVESFLPEDKRFQLAMALNNLMASPSFAAWLNGAPLSIDSLLYAGDGRPKHSIFYIAHLSEPERMFFVTLLLNAIVGWMRKQPGTTSLRALLYFDEVFGFLPPVATPPSKRPLLTILKQARAFGLGTVLVTQNPVDLDYKALSNTGTWFIGRLQSKQDQQRLLEGLRTASATRNTSIASLSESIGQLKSRVFLMNNVHDDAPVAFHARWAMNYLRGPMTRAQLRTLADHATEPTDDASEGIPHDLKAYPVTARSTSRPVLPPGLSERFLVPVDREHSFRREGVIYRSTVGAFATTHFVDRKHDVATNESTIHYLPVNAPGPNTDWSRATTTPLLEDAVASDPPDENASFVGGLPPYCSTKDDARKLGEYLEDWLYHNRRLSLLYSETLDILQRVYESDEAFRGRLELAAREQRDEAIDRASDIFQRRIDRLEVKQGGVQRSIAEQEDRYSARKQEELLSLGETIFGIILGRRRRLTSVATKRRMTSNARAKLESLDAKDQEIKDQLLELQQAFEEDVQGITRNWDGVVQRVSSYEIAPRRTDVVLDFIGVLWLPYRKDIITGEEHPAFELARS